MSHQNKKNFNIQKLVSLVVLLTFFAVGCSKKSDAEKDQSDNSRTDQSSGSDSADGSVKKAGLQSIAGKKFTSMGVDEDTTTFYYFCGEKGAKSGNFVIQDGFEFKTGTWKIVGDSAVVHYTSKNSIEGIGSHQSHSHGKSYSKFTGKSEKIDEKVEFTEGKLPSNAQDFEGACPTYNPSKEILKEHSQSQFTVNDAAGKLYLKKEPEDSPFWNELYLCGEKGASSGKAFSDVQASDKRESRTGTWKLNGNRIEVNYTVLQTTKLNIITDGSAPMGTVKYSAPSKKNISENKEYTEESIRSGRVFEYTKACPTSLQLE